LAPAKKSGAGKFVKAAVGEISTGGGEDPLPM
jgi:hypothetical protein